MRQFILGGNTAYLSNIKIGKKGAVGFAYLNDGVMTPVTSASDAGKIAPYGYIVLKQDDETTITLPFCKSNFSYSAGTTRKSQTFTCTVTVPTDVEAYADYSIIIAKKGVGFNERNKWTINHHSSVKDTAVTIAKALVDLANANTPSTGVKAEANGAVITFTALNSGVDYKIIPSDELMGVEPVVSADLVVPGIYETKDIVNLAMMAAADAGIEYTYQDDVRLLYPKYPLNPLASEDSEDKEWKVFTLRFAEPRAVKTRDEVVNQIVQIAFPKDAAQIETFEAICEALID